MSDTAHVIVETTVLWRAPSAPRAVDACALAPAPDIDAWLTDMDAHKGPAGRLGLLGRADSQLVWSEPVEVLDADRCWSRVCCPWQPSALDPRGYPGWVPSPHLSEQWPVDDRRPPESADRLDARALRQCARSQRTDPLVVFARSQIGVPYLWAGTTRRGFDCSGLVHYGCRMLGRVVPRDAGDLRTACDPVATGSERPGDLYFFGADDAHVSHVGVVVSPGRMVHAPATGDSVREDDLTARQRSRLLGIGRVRSELGSAQLDPTRGRSHRPWRASASRTEVSWLPSIG